MPLALVVEDGTGIAGANTYISLANAETYFESRLYSDTWDAATDDEKNRALAMAVRLFESHVQWDGLKTDDDQVLQWPRDDCYDREGNEYESDDIPTFLKDAQCELANFLLQSDRISDPDTKGYSRLRAGTLEAVIAKYDRPAVIPDFIWDLIGFCASRAQGKQRTLVRM